MKHLQIYLFFLIAISVSCSSGKDEDTPKRKIIWQDEFNEDGTPDPEKWTFAGRNTPDWACYCTDDPSTAFVRDGKLHLVGKLSENPEDTAKYNTGCISTKEKFDFKYGRIEVKAKLSKGKGSWPAIWMMPSENKYGGWPHSGEIDIMEHLNFDNFVYQTVHSEYVDIQNKRQNPDYSTTASFKEGDFNTYGMEWYPDSIVFMINNKKKLTYPKVEKEGAAQWPFDQPFYIILDQALGGNWVGEIIDEDLPVTMEVDWVRVYQ
ncbi:glycoside hydrolase family 16 protein [Marinilabilia salmonicolor]|jgi:beta-glucanase (GH16 family)|uniref:Glycosyl hydrolase family 16 n=1 Tax=Marinilabilia salmonicolor TaxID=989 RepID=A0A368US13_9BACT|nr:glycoside hydrolase family 16 protein [Marinilabilia salmonicolor]RCW31572.1 glycosyl hydrolase family 16 [Marinilabilia salmonicolor]